MTKPALFHVSMETHFLTDGLFMTPNQKRGGKRHHLWARLKSFHHEWCLRKRARLNWANVVSRSQIGWWGGEEAPWLQPNNGAGFHWGGESSVYLLRRTWTKFSRPIYHLEAERSDLTLQVWPNSGRWKRTQQRAHIHTPWTCTER